MRHKITTNNLLVLFAVMLVLAFATGCNNNGKAQETRIDFTNNFSGSFQDSILDVNEDGETGVIVNLQGSLGSLGPVTFQSYFEGDAFNPDGPPCTTPNGLPGVLLNLVESDTVFRLQVGELIFSRSVSGSACFPVTPGDNSFGFTAVDDVIGGTGMFENATGSIDTDGVGIILIGLGEFGGITGVQTGEIVIE